MPEASPIKSPARRRVAGGRKEAVEADNHEEHKHTNGNSNKAFHYEFGGPLGALASTVLLPPLVLVLYFACNGEYCIGLSNWREFVDHLPRSWRQVVTPTGWGIFLGWLAFQWLLDRLLPGEKIQGAPLKNGSRLSYKINGHLCFWATLLILGHAVPQFDAAGNVIGLGAAPLALLYDHFVEIAAAACIFSCVMASALYVASFRSSKPGLAHPGSSGNHFNDYWMGRELNPRIGSFDLKFFCELRPGIIGWTVLNLAMAAKQRELTSHVSLPMLAVVFCQGMYAWDALHNERSILTTMDITTDGFGFMLVFGDLAWVPFVYTIQARYLVDHEPVGLSQPLGVLAVVALHFFGYFVFRGANGEKDAFRRDPAAPEVANLRWMDTKRGTKLLVSGWWGLARKINYTGDWLMSLSWCMTTGFGHAMPYFYAAYFAVLLVHRALRDDCSCQEKYGADWARYKRLVPALFVPWIV